MAELISWHKCLAAILDDAPTGLISWQSAKDRWLQIFDKKPKAQLSVVLVLVLVFVILVLVLVLASVLVLVCFV